MDNGKIRIVALFDLPENVFAETRVNTTILVGYKSSKKRLAELVADDYSVFKQDILKDGYLRRKHRNELLSLIMIMHLTLILLKR